MLLPLGALDVGGGRRADRQTLLVNHLSVIKRKINLKFAASMGIKTHFSCEAPVSRNPVPSR